MKVTLAVYTADYTDRTSLPSWPASTCDTPGLVVCYLPEVSPTDDGYRADDGCFHIPAKQELNPNRYYYQIIHVNSGMSVISDLTNSSLAFVLANRLSGLDWTVSEEEVKRNLDYGKLVRSVWGGEK